MKTIPKHQNNLAGIAKVWLIPSSRISSILFTSTTEPEDIPAGWDADAWELDPIFQSASFSEESKQSAAGTFYESTVSFKLSKFVFKLKIFLLQVNTMPFSILMRTQDGQYILVGCDEFPMRSAAALKSGVDLTDLNHLALTFTGKNPNPAIWVSAPPV